MGKHNDNDIEAAKQYPSQMEDPQLRWGFIRKNSIQILNFFMKFSVSILMGMFLHRHPLNMIMLGLFTFAFSLIVGVACVFSKGKIILEASILTLVVSVSLTLFTFWAAKRGYDFNFLWPFLFCALILILLFSIIQIFFPMGSLVRMLISFFVALVYCGFIIYDTDNLIKRCSYDEYVLAAAMLYMDMIQLFLAILQILGFIDD
ncbi:protein LIFEGUARD 4-like [Bidens hawaiensis]|uniref:protein LIFEGUARD 4-like n=1 Tax=Bidens hawaiensis TaxID=980011 RepID=UPI00404AFFD3